jgi:large subunit ribosomal protein L14
MIQSISILKVADNSGAKTVRCIKVLGGFKRKYSKIGEIIVVSIQTLRNKSKDTSKVKKKEVYKALIVQTKIKYKKINGFMSKLNENSVILLNKQGNPVASRILVPVMKHFLSRKFQKVMGLSSGSL